MRRGPHVVRAVVFTRLGKKESCARVKSEDALPMLLKGNETPLFPPDFASALDLYATLARQAACVAVTQIKGEAFPLKRLLELL